MEKLINIGKVLEHQLNEVGIFSYEDLKEKGSKAVWLEIKKIDSSACINRLYALEGAIRKVKDTDLPESIKKDLKDFYNKNKTMYTLKPAKISDKEILIKFKLSTILESSNNIDEEEKDKITNYVKKYIPNNIEYYQIILVDNEKVGCFSLKPYEDGFMIEEIYLLENYRNKGIGSSIISNAINKNKRPIYLYVLKNNVKAIELYKRFEFKVIKEENNRYLMVLE